MQGGNMVFKIWIVFLNETGSNSEFFTACVKFLF